MPKCPLCETELEKISDTELFCPKEEMTFKLSKGRMVVQPDDPDKKGKIRLLEEELAEHRLELNRLKEFLIGDSRREFWE